MQFPRQFTSRVLGVRPLAIVVWLVGTLPTIAAANSNACVHFDVPQMVACHPVQSSAEGQPIFEAIFDVSTLLTFGHEQDVEQLLFVVDSPSGNLFVSDYEPKTELTSSYVGHIERNQQQETSRNAGLSASFSPNDLVNAQGNATQGTKANESVRYQTLPPMQLLAASGTVSRGTAVYFKFRSTPQTTLDGSRQLRVMFRMPSGWRADYVYLRCVAYRHSRDAETAAICGSTDFLVPLYLAGDEEAREAGRQLSASEFELRQIAREIAAREKTRGVSLSDKFVAIFKDDEPRLPQLWLTTILSSNPDRREFSFQNRLPLQVRRAVTDFTEARSQVAQLNQ